MQLVSFNLFRTLGLPNTTFIKPESFQRHPEKYQAQIEAADWVLFPEYWQLNGLLYSLNSRIFPSESTYRIGHNKIEMTRAIQLLTPSNLPRTLIAANNDSDAGHLWQAMELPFVAKLAKASQGEGVWLIEDRQQWLEYRQRADSLYVQEHLPIDRDLRIVMVGNEVIAAYWRHQSERSFHTNVSRGGHVSYDDVPAAAIDYVQQLARKLNINHAGFDIAMVDGHPYLLEFNRLFGNQGIPGGGRAITDAMLRYLQQHSSDHTPWDPESSDNFTLAV
ncbi:RimK family alpha-L-glutamate ligase [Pseudomaricurvus sp. HS19]|uniref:ATP-grasp domain-containing protein n=1 Tax=Pseudomaricurvus sp. HS19 TaxID=2692626 RepID=UPI00136B1FB4|nr:hypothetical protein [Pseudomaricurvus sp. HS19]MYM61842.1 hypothetical protein [Pseudomaricurvus sp. HS19]